MNERTKPNSLDQAIDEMQRDLGVALKDGDGFAGTVPPATADELGRYMRNSGRMLDLARQKQIELRAAYDRKRQLLIHRLSDDLARLEVEHEGEARIIGEVISRLEAMRS